MHIVHVPNHPGTTTVVVSGHAARPAANPRTALALWAGGLFGFCGLHRFYVGRWGTGLLYLATFGLFGVGQLVDLLRLRRLVARGR